MTKHFNELSPADAELLACLSEEAGEVTQVVGKTLRYGWNSERPGTGKVNYQLLEEEIGDLLAIAALLSAEGKIQMSSVLRAALRKSERVNEFLHHATSSPRKVREELAAGWYYLQQGDSHAG